MKKVLPFLLVLCLLSGSAFAADWSGYSLDELRAAVLEINAEIAGRDEWEGVKVPAGSWIVGEDIPAGAYSVSVVSGTVRMNVFESKTAPSWDSHQIIKDDSPLGKIELQEGMRVELDKIALFARPLSLGF